MSLASDNDALALRWAGPFGYAVLQVLRRLDRYGEADFAHFAALAPTDETQAPPGPSALQLDLPPAPPVATPPAEPAPPPEFYRRVTPALGRPGEPASPAGRRDASGRYVRPAR